MKMSLQKLCWGIFLASSSLLNCGGKDYHMYDLYADGFLIGMANKSWCDESSNTYVVSLYSAVFYGEKPAETNLGVIMPFGKIEVEHMGDESSICSRAEQVYPHAAIIALGAYNIETEAFESNETYQLSPSEFKRLWPLP